MGIMGKKAIKYIKENHSIHNNIAKKINPLIKWFGKVDF